jgi:hypothetical protein
MHCIASASLKSDLGKEEVSLGACFLPRWTDVIILKIFFAKKIGEKWRFGLKKS